MPQLGETVAEGKISKWFVAAGDAVKPGDNLFEIETDKVSMEVPAIAAGTLAEIRVSAGEVAPVGAVVAVITSKGEKATTSPPLIPAQAGIQNVEALGPRRSLSSGGPQARPGGGDERQPTPKPAIPMEPFREVRTPERNYGPARLAGGITVTPLARRLAGEGGIDVSSITGSGPHGRIVARDVEGARVARLTTPAVSRRAAATPAQAVPAIVLTADVAIGAALALCDQANAVKKDGAPALELADVVIKAWALALARVVPSQPSGIATVSGASRTVIRNAAGQSLTAISAMRRDPAAGSGATDEPQGASTAISNPGVHGITSIVDVLHPPQVAMLSVGAPRRAPVEASDGSVKFIDAMTATLSCDHRVIDAALGAELLSAFKGFVKQPVTMIV